MDTATSRLKDNFMAMNGNTMGDEVVAAIKSVTGAATHPQDAQVTLIWEAICTAIVKHIKDNAVVTQPNDSNNDTEMPGSIS
jgi:hypothetical protein